MPLAEVQAEWIAKVLSNQVRLPNREKMLAEIEADRQAMKKRYKDSPRHTLQVDFYPYKESIEQEIKRMKA
ncbi:MAG: hypothetical protein U0Y10_26940 [Spirosomataceae bacterium]